MSWKEKIDIIRKGIECCFVKGSCYPCPFYEEPCQGKPGRCLGMKNAGNLIIAYLDDIEKEIKDGKEKR